MRKTSCIGLFKICKVKNISAHFLLLLLALTIHLSAQATPQSTTFQARIIKPDGNYLEDANVPFRFTILAPVASCILSVEDFSIYSMTGSRGTVAINLGKGAAVYIAAPAANFSEIFNNFPSGPFNCQGGGTYMPTSDDSRRVIPQFYALGQWNTLPVLSVNSVPYANYAGLAAKLTGLPNCNPATEALTYNGTAFACLTTGGGAGTVTNVTGTSPISVSNGGTTPAISIATANTSTTGALSSTDWNTFNGKQASGNYVTTLSGDVTSSGFSAGTVTATIAANAVTTAKINDGAITAAKLSSMDASTGQIMKWNGSAWVASSDISGVGTETDPNVPAWAKASSLDLTTAVNGTLPIANGGTGAATVASNLVFAGPASGGPLAPSFRTLASSDIPSLSASYLTKAGVAGGQTASGGTAASDNLTLDSTTNATKGYVLLQPTGGLVGIGTTAPTSALHVMGAIQSSAPNDFSSLMMVRTGSAADEKIWDVTSRSNYLEYRAVADAYASAQNYLEVHRTGPNITSVLFPNGNLGIGTASPAAKLDTAGMIRSTDLAWPAVGTGKGLEMGYHTIWDLAWIAAYDRTAATYKNLALNNSVTILGAGNVGIGTTAPTAVLHLKAGTTAANTAPLKLSSGDLTTAPEAGAIEYDGTNIFYTDSTATRRALASASGGGSFTNVTSITGSGDLTVAAGAGNQNLILAGSGTGVVTTASPLTITNATASTNSGTGAATISGGLGVGGDIYAGASVNAGTTVTAATSVISPQIYGATVASGDIKIDGTSNAAKGNVLLATVGGNVGIGTTSPDFLLEVKGASPTLPTQGQVSIFGSETTGAAGTGGGLVFVGHDGTSSGRVWGHIQSLKENSTNGDVSSYMTFATRAHPAGPVEKMRITPSGNVGIGTATPLSKLSVHNAATNGTSVDGQLNSILYLDNGAGSDGSIVIKSHTAGSAKTAGAIKFASSPDAVNYNWAGIRGMSTTVNGNSDTLAFYTSAINTSGASSTERMRIDGNGNVGIGTASPTAALHLKAGTTAANTAPLKLTSGDLTTAPEAGAVEYDGTNLYYTDGATTRRTIATTSGTSSFNNVTSINNSAGNITLAAQTTTGSVLVNSGKASTGSANGALVVTGGVGVSGDVYSAASINAGTTMSAATSVLTPQLYGSSVASGDIKIDGTSHATKGNVLLASAGGNVGVGTATPSELLVVGDDVGNLTATSKTLVVGDSTGNARFYLAKDSNNFGTLFWDATNNLLSFETKRAGVNYPNGLMLKDGNVGIGTTGPSSRLQIGDATANTANQLVIGKYEASTEGNLPIIQQKSVVNAGIGNDLALGSQSSTSGILFYTGLTGVGNQLGTGSNAVRMTIDNTGNVGIGTTTFGANGLLQVNGDVGLAGTRSIRPASNADTDSLRYLGTQLVIGRLNSHAIGYTGGGLIASKSNSAGEVLLDVGSYSGANALKVINDGTGLTGTMTYMGGNVGIGTTAPSAALHLKAGTTAANTAPLKLTSGDLTTAPEAGAIEYDGVNLFYTDSTATRRALASASGSFTNVTSITGSGALTVAAGGTNQNLTLTGSGTGVVTTANLLTITNATASTSPTNGALVVSGGVGVGGALNVSGDVNVAAGKAYMYNGANVITALTALENYFFGGAGNFTMTGIRNTATGIQALLSNTIGNNNTAYGFIALQNNITGAGNTAFGSGALQSSTGSYNTALGINAGSNLTAGSNNTIIGGNSIAFPSATGSNQLNIGNIIYGTAIDGTGTTLSTGKIGIGTTAPSEKLEVAGNIRASGQLSSGSQTISAGATATIDWNNGNAISTNYTCATDLILNNLRDGGTYTLVITDTGTTQCNFAIATTGTDAATVSYRFKPANAARTATSHSVYTLMRVGTVVYVSWASGF